MSNDAATGYIVMTLKALNYKNEDIDAIVNELHFAFDLKTEKEAEDYYNSSAWK